MKDMYTSYFCNRCKKETILITEEIKDTMRNGNYISCSHCGSKRLIEENKTNDLRECMKHDSYKRVRGALRQVRI